MERLKKLIIKSPTPGTSLAIFGAIHGNEPAGSIAIQNIYDRLVSDDLVLKRGHVTFVPIANPKAYAENKRFIEEDLNRVFRDTENPQTYEQELANKLGNYIKESEVFLDIHTTSAPGPTCVFIDFPTPENTAFAEAMGMEYAITGWPSVYAHNPNGLDSYDTTRYAYEQGKIGIIIECGQHEESGAIPIAERSILRALAHFGMIDLADLELGPVTAQQTIIMEQIVYKEHNGDSFVKKWKHLEEVKEGTVLAIRADGNEIRAEKDLILLLPKHNAQAGQEWFYVGTK
jgi:predicted deacylase